MTAWEQIRAEILLTIALEVVCAFSCYKWGWHRGAAHAYQNIVDRIRAGDFPTFSISPDGKSITCHVCGMISHNTNDVREKYCGKCHVFHEDRAKTFFGK